MGPLQLGHMTTIFLKIFCIMGYLKNTRNGKGTSKNTKMAKFEVPNIKSKFVPQF